MVITYDTTADVLYLFATDRVRDPQTLEQAPRQQAGTSGSGLTIYGDQDKTILGVRCDNASTQSTLAGLAVGGMPSASIETMRCALATLKAVLDPVDFEQP